MFQLFFLKKKRNRCFNTSCRWTIFNLLELQVGTNTGARIYQSFRVRPGNAKNLFIPIGNNTLMIKLTQNWLKDHFFQIMHNSSCEIIPYCGSLNGQRFIQRIMLSMSPQPTGLNINDFIVQLMFHGKRRKKKKKQKICAKTFQHKQYKHLKSSGSLIMISKK